MLKTTALTLSTLILFATHSTSATTVPGSIPGEFAVKASRGQTP